MPLTESLGVITIVLNHFNTQSLIIKAMTHRCPDLVQESNSALLCKMTESPLIASMHLEEFLTFYSGLQQLKLFEGVFLWTVFFSLIFSLCVKSTQTYKSFKHKSQGMLLLYVLTWQKKKQIKILSLISLYL